jgi:hypothetical protein
MSGGREHIQVFAVIRLDLFSLHEQPELSVKVVEVLPDWPSAEAEAARLGQVNEGKQVKYLAQSTRWYPSGRHVGGS